MSSTTYNIQNSTFSGVLSGYSSAPCITTNVNNPISTVEYHLRELQRLVNENPTLTDEFERFRQIIRMSL